MSRRLTARERLDAATPEHAVVEALIAAARLGGWLVSHHPDSRKLLGDPGIPDLTLAHPPRGVLFIEAKTRAGRLRAGQIRWRTVLEGAGAAVAVVRPGALDTMAGWLANSDTPAGEHP